MGGCYVGCGHCLFCRMKYASTWAQRLMDEKAFHDRSVFVTLTYNDEHLPKGNTLVKSDCQKFLKRLRKMRSCRYYLAGEYGDRGQRPHYHAIIFGVGVEDAPLLEKAWTLDGEAIGFVDVKKVEYGSCAYVARYVVKKQVGRVGAIEYARRGVIPEFCLMSRNPGMGARHVEKYKEEIFNRGFSVVCGHRSAIPKFYVKKVYDTGERMEKRKVEMARVQEEYKMKMLDRRDGRGYNYRSELEKLDSEGTKNMIEGKLRLKSKVL